jgi:3,2-trans-enoyl-CoA isomerase
MAPQYVQVDMRPGGLAYILLKREPVNLMDLTMWQQLLAALEQLEADQVHALPLRCFG